MNFEDCMNFRKPFVQVLLLFFQIKILPKWTKVIRFSSKVETLFNSLIVWTMLFKVESMVLIRLRIRTPVYMKFPVSLDKAKG
jgi:hypothetical protein